MSLSEEIILGSTLLTAKAGTVYEDANGKIGGCAFGMAAVAIGCGFTSRSAQPGENNRTLGAADV